MRKIALFALGAVSLVSVAAVQAQSFPNKPIRIVVSTAPGGSPDVLARTVGQKLSENMGQQVIVDNRPGAGGLLSAELVMAAQADGYTLLMADSSVVSINPHFPRNASFEPLKHLVPVSLSATSPLYLIAHAGAGISSVKELIALAKAKPGLLYGSAGNGGAHHLAMEALKLQAGLDMNHVPYKGGAQVVPAVMSGDVVVAFAGLNLAGPQAKAGKIRILASATAKRSALSPEIPTIAESGVPGFELTPTLGFFAPIKTPRDIVEKLNAELIKAVKSPEVQQRLAVLGVEGVGISTEQYAEILREENIQYGKLVKATGARVD